MGSVSVSARGGREGSLSQSNSLSWRSSSFSSFRMLRLMLCSTVFLCLIVPAPAPFAKSDPRSIFNFLIEPWWCIVPRIVRELLHLKYFGTPLNEVGPCTLKADGSSPEPEPEGEPESEPYAEPEPRNPRRRPVAEPEAEPRNGRLRTEPVPEPEKLSPEPESAPAKLSPESQLELIQIMEEQAALRERLERILGGGGARPEPEPEAESEPERSRGSSVPVVKSREPHHKVYFIES